ncbi:4-alpha-glucanotransferase, partial [Burkholderia pseudomallei]
MAQRERERRRAARPRRRREAHAGREARERRERPGRRAMTADPRHPSIVELADAAGLDAHWIDASGFARRVGDDMLAALLDALGYPCDTRAARAESAARLAAHAQA